MNWLKEGDFNISFFHNVMKDCFRRNVISFINIEEGRMEKVEEVKGIVKSHFETNFLELNKNRPMPEGLQLNGLSHEDNFVLEEPFT